MSEPLLSPQEAVRLNVPVDVEGIRRAIAKLLENPEVDEFIRELLRLTAEEAAKEQKPDKPNTLFANGDLLKIFDEVVRQGGIRRAEGNEANHAVGSLATRNATIRIGAIFPGKPMTKTELLQMYVSHDIAYAVHETLHHAGIFGYSDAHYARAVCRMLGTPFTEGKDKFKYSNDWNKELVKRCKLKAI